MPKVTLPSYSRRRRKRSEQPACGFGSSGFLSVAENATVGSVVGSFTATDPDATTLRYFLYDGNGTPGNAFFSLDLNGTLRTAAVLDYEANASHLIGYACSMRWKPMPVPSRFTCRTPKRLRSLILTLRIFGCMRMPVGSYAANSVLWRRTECERSLRAEPRSSRGIPQVRDRCKRQLANLGCFGLRGSKSMDSRATAVNDFNESASRSFVLEVLNLFEPPVN